MTVQEPLFGGIVPPVKVTVDAPRGAVTFPPQSVLALSATSIPVGSVSVSGAVRLVAVLSGLLRVRVRVDVPSALIVTGLKALPSVGGRWTPGGAAHTEIATALESIVTAPFWARALPDTFVLVLRVILVSARIFPMNDVFVPIVAELPICQKTLHC